MIVGPDVMRPSFLFIINNNIILTKVTAERDVAIMHVIILYHNIYVHIDFLIMDLTSTVGLSLTGESVYILLLDVYNRQM